MAGFDIITDSTANLPDAVIRNWQLKILSLEFIVDGKTYKSYDPVVKTDNKQFYEMMRQGKTVQTSLASLQDAEAAVCASFAAGQDVLYLGFDSALSGHYDAMSEHFFQIQARDYPQRRLRCQDSLAAALGHGLLVSEAVRRREHGSGLDELADWLGDNRLSVAHWFTVDELKYLQRGGRLSKGAAFAGTLLNIKPVLHVDDQGRLVPVAKIRGRRQAVQAMFERLEKGIRRPTAGQSVYISHADCLKDAEWLRDLVAERFSDIDFLINDLDPVIGAHAGPGTLAVFFFTDGVR
ncbi:MAG: DegV family protein [Actinomycetia bacterium]|nr:DegV family protein [Actinomycetes bacterium]